MADAPAAVPDEKAPEAKAKHEDDEDDEDVFDRFTDPGKKRKRKQKKEETEEERKAKIVNMGKRWAKDEFNSPPTPDQVALWSGYVTDAVPSVAELERLTSEADTLTVDALGYIPLSKVNGLFSIMDCLNAMMHCKTWLNERLERVGWKLNLTGYDPVAVSHSSKEVLAATLECYRMALKQMRSLELQRSLPAP